MSRDGALAWPGQRIRDRIAAGGLVTRQGTHVQIEMPGGSISWTRAEHFDRAVGTDMAASTAIAVMPTAPFDKVIATKASAGLLDFLGVAVAGRRRV